MSLKFAACCEVRPPYSLQTGEVEHKCSWVLAPRDHDLHLRCLRGSRWLVSILIVNLTQVLAGVLVYLPFVEPHIPATSFHSSFRAYFAKMCASKQMVCSNNQSLGRVYWGQVLVSVIDCLSCLRLFEAHAHLLVLIRLSTLPQLPQEDQAFAICGKRLCWSLFWHLDLIQWYSFASLELVIE